MKILNALTTNAWDSLSSSFNFLWSKLSPVLLPLVLILVFLAIGLYLAGFLSDKLGALVKKSKIDSLLDKVLAPVSKFTGIKLNSLGIISGLIKWFLIALVLIAALDLANLHSVISFIGQIIGFIPNVFVAALIIIAGSMFADLAAYLVSLVTKNGFSGTARVAVNALALIAALSQIVTPIISSLSQFIGHLSLSKLQADVLFIGIIVLAVYASKGAVTKIVENLYKS